MFKKVPTLVTSTIPASLTRVLACNYEDYALSSCFMRETFRFKTNAKPAALPAPQTLIHNEMKPEPCSKDRTCARPTRWESGTIVHTPVPKACKPSILLHRPRTPKAYVINLDQKTVNDYLNFSILRLRPKPPCPRSDLRVFSIEYCSGRRAEGSRKSFGLAEISKIVVSVVFPWGDGAHSISSKL